DFLAQATQLHDLSRAMARDWSATVGANPDIEVHRKDDLFACPYQLPRLHLFMTLVWLPLLKIQVRIVLTHPLVRDGIRARASGVRVRLPRFSQPHQEAF